MIPAQCIALTASEVDGTDKQTRLPLCKASYRHKVSVVVMLAVAESGIMMVVGNKKE